MDKKFIIENCRKLLNAYKNGLLGQTIMPEDTNPGLEKINREERLSYFTLPMSLNYQRDSYKLWQAALKTFSDEETKEVFNVSFAAKQTTDDLRTKLLKYKLALQPNKHINTWLTISRTINDNWGTFSNLIDTSKKDFLKVKKTVQKDFKNGFPYLSGEKIFNYWSFVMGEYGGINWKNKQYIEIAPDTHITKCSVKLGIITQKEAETLSKEKISEKWRILLEGSEINPIDMHPPLWFWSRNGFLFLSDNVT